MADKPKTATAVGMIPPVAQAMSMAIFAACEQIDVPDAIGGTAHALSKMLATSAPDLETMRKNTDIIARSILACAEANWAHNHPDTSDIPETGEEFFKNAKLREPE